MVKPPVPTMEEPLELWEVLEVGPPGTDEEEFENVPPELEIEEAVDVPVPRIEDREPDTTVPLMAPVENGPVVEEALAEGNGTEEDWLLDALLDNVEVCGASQV